MHYNLRVEIERVRSEYVTQIEVASVGRAGRKRLVSPTFQQAIKDLTAAHDELLGHIEAYHQAPAPVVEVPPAKVEKLDVAPPPPPAPKKATKAVAKANAKKGAPKAAKPGARKFASE